MSRTILMRHGFTDYQQGNSPVSVEEANDLTEEGILAVSSSAVDISELLTAADDVVIYSSRMGRALHTAKIVRNHLEKKSISVDLLPTDELREVDNFNWALFEESVRSLELKITSEDTDKWFSLDPLNSLSPDMITSLPSRLKDFIDKVETAEEATTRLLSFLSSIAKEPRSKILVTHDGLLCQLLRKLTNDTFFSCRRTHFYEIILNSDHFPTAIGRNNLGYRI